MSGESEKNGFAEFFIQSRKNTPCVLPGLFGHVKIQHFGTIL